MRGHRCKDVQDQNRLTWRLEGERGQEAAFRAPSVVMSSPLDFICEFPPCKLGSET